MSEQQREQLITDLQRRIEEDFARWQQSVNQAKDNRQDDENRCAREACGSVGRIDFSAGSLTLCAMAASLSRSELSSSRSRSSRRSGRSSRTISIRFCCPCAAIDHRFSFTQTARLQRVTQILGAGLDVRNRSSRTWRGAGRSWERRRRSWTSSCRHSAERASSCARRWRRCKRGRRPATKNCTRAGSCRSTREAWGCSLACGW